MIKLLIISSNF